MLIGSGVKDDNYWWERANKEAEERDSNIEIYDIDEMIGEGFSPVIKSMSGATKQDDSDAYEDFNENHIEVESDEVVTSNLVDMNISPKEPCRGSTRA